MNTATRDTEGRREIEAAKQRLANAKSHASFVSTTLETAKVAAENARVTAISAKEQSNAATVALESAKKMADKATKIAASTIENFVNTKEGQR